MTSIAEWQSKVHALAVEKGWHKKPMVSPTGRLNRDRIAATIAMKHSELSEAIEELRNPRHDLKMYLREDGKPEGFVVELADLMIRVMDTCEALGLDLEGAMEAKHTYNGVRPYRHGGKAL